MKKAFWYVPLSVVAVLAVVVIVWLVSGSRELPSHSVTLSWNAPRLGPGVVLAGYNVYRRTAEGGPFVRIAERVAGPPYEDRLVNSGRKYVYAVTTLDQKGRESKFSSEVDAEIP